MTVIYQCILISNWQSSNWINQPKTENREKRNLGVVHLKGSQNQSGVRWEDGLCKDILQFLLCRLQLTTICKTQLSKMHLTKYNKQFTVYMNMMFTSPLRISESAKLYGSKSKN